MKQKFLLIISFIFLVNMLSYSQPTQEMQKCYLESGHADEYFGSCVSISEEKAIIGIPNAFNVYRRGGYRLYTNINGIWEPSLSVHGVENSELGSSVSISGNYAVAGCPNPNTSVMEYVVVNHYNGNNWTSQHINVPGGFTNNKDRFGCSVHISGNYLIVGAESDDELANGAGAAFIYYNNSGTWELQKKLMAPDGANFDNFGHSVSISGTTAVVGANLDDGIAVDIGSVYIYRYYSGDWHYSQKITGTNLSGYENFGYSVALSSGGSLVIGSPFENTKSGAAYFYYEDGGSWWLKNKVNDPEDNIYDYFGKSVSINNGYTIIGAPGDNENGTNSGAAYIFENSISSWVLNEKITASDGSVSDNFGSVSISDNYALIGAKWDIIDGVRKGSAYFFEPVPPPTITIHPLNQINICDQTDAQFTIQGENIENFQWQVLDPSSGYTVDISDNQYYSGTISNTLTVHANSNLNNFQFRCNVSNVTGEAFSDYALLTVKESPTILTQPADQLNVCENSSTHYSVSGEEINTYQWQVADNPFSIPKNIKNNEFYSGTKTSTLTVIPKLSFTNNYYRCVITNECGTTFTDFALLTVVENPVINIQPIDQIDVCGQSNVIFSISGENITDYQWQVSTNPAGIPINIHDNEYYNGAQTSSLTVTVHPDFDMYEYRCMVSNNGCNLNSDFASLTVEHELPKFELREAIAELNEYGTVEITQKMIIETISDNCGIENVSIDPNIFTCDDIGENTIEVKVKDDSGNISGPKTTIVNIVDNLPPVPNIENLPNIIAECSVNNISIPTASDNCAGLINGSTPDIFPITNQGTTIITWSYNDGNGNIVTQEQTIIIDDQTNPIPNVQYLPNITAECSVDYIEPPTATDNCEGLITGTTTTVFPVTQQGTTEITWTYDDGNGNSVNQKQFVIIEDITAPIPDLSQLPDIIAECSVESVSLPTATDNCIGSLNGTTTTEFPITEPGTTVITWTYDDGNGNTSTQNQNIIITDISGPVPNIENLIDIFAECSVESITAPTATDNCTGTIIGTTTTEFPITNQGITIVVWEYDDGSGNIVTQNQNVIINDSEFPVPNAAFLLNIGAECVVETVTPPTATDNCVGTVMGVTSTVFPITTQGTTVIIWEFNDGNGNIVTQTQNVIIDDTSMPIPDLSVLPDIIAECSVDNMIAPTATDNCSGTITAATSTIFPITVQGTTVVIWEYNDGNGNIVTQNQNVIINDVSNPVPDLSVLPDILAECSVEIISPPTATDNCEETIIGTTNAIFPITDFGTTVITWTYEDANGNSITQNQNIIISDITGPVPDIQNLPDIVVECSATNISIPTATDNCSGIIIGITTTVFPITGQGTTIVVWEYDDGNGNITTQNQNIIIEDVTGPVPDIASLPEIEEYCVVNTVTAPTASDNCSGNIVGTTSTVFPITEIGTTVITWEYEDTNGNTSTQQQNIVVNQSIVISTQPVSYINVCENSGNITLSVSATGQGSLSYSWLQDGNDLNVNSPSITFDSDINYSGIYVCVITDGDCTETSGEAEVVIDEFIQADAGDDDFFYDLTSCQLDGNSAFPGTGTWSSDQTQVNFNDANLNIATASNLPEGLTTFTWQITNGACIDDDQVQIYRFITGNTITLSLSDCIAYPGELNQTVDLYLDNQSGLSVDVYETDVKIMYDATSGIHANGNYYLTDRTLTGTTVNLSVNESNPTESYVHVQLNNSNGIQNGIGSILQVLFDVEASANTPEVIEISMDDATCEDEFSQLIAVDYFATGEFNIWLFGDLNGDGFITTADLLILVEIWDGSETDPILVEAADLNEDGDVDGEDVDIMVDLISGGKSYIESVNGINKIFLPYFTAQRNESNNSFAVSAELNNNISVICGKFNYNSNIGFDITSLKLSGELKDFELWYRINDSDPENVIVSYVIYSLNKEFIKPDVRSILNVYYETSLYAAGKSPLVFTETDMVYNAENTDVENVNGQVKRGRTKTSIEEITLSLSLYPNPVKELVNIVNTGNTDQSLDIVLKDVSGKELLHNKFKGEKHVIDMSNYAYGVYFIEISNSNTKVIKKIIKQ